MLESNCHLNIFSCSLPEFDQTAITEAYSDDASHINSTLTSVGSSLANLLPAAITQECSNAFNPNNSAAVDLTELVRLRFLHQTKQAETGVRMVGKATDTLENPESMFQKKQLLTERQKILREFNNIIKRQEDQGVGTGLERKARWQNGTTHEDVSAVAPGLAHGNSANAEAVAKATASKVSQLNVLLMA